MVDLLEFEGKELFKLFGIEIPKGQLIHSTKDFRDFEEEHVIKAQVPTGHRGVNGGVLKFKTNEEFITAFNKVSSLTFNGFKPTSFLVEKAIQHKKELYVALTLDRSNKSPVLLVSPEGGVDIENIPKTRIKGLDLDIFIGMLDYQKRRAFEFIGLDEKYRVQFYSILSSMWRIFTEKDAELVEINPLAVTDSELIALDSKVSIEDDSLFRHSEYKRNEYSSDELEMKAKKKGISFVRLNGNIGLIANGAGLTLATIDQIKLNGGVAGDFLDLGGTDDPARVAEAIELVKESNPKVLFINIFGGVTKADTVAEGIIQAINKLNITFKIVVRLKGFNEVKGKELLRKNGIDAFTDMGEAIKEVVKLAGYGNSNR
ncbi:MAG: ADP-forming succinate--CoA ligase subunit beta [Candidatus Parvarchaeota archaeon]|nr:ADP-forming succinate--CoA ligase subunit beta [Candidatus Parvarchaeum tengchongense]